MKRKVATLDVYVDTETTDQPSGIRSESPGLYELTMYPNQDCTPARTREQFQTIMAHELGHFILMVTNDPTHHSDAIVAGKMLGSAMAELPGEKKAWDIAHLIYPDLLKSSERSCLSSYEEAARDEKRHILATLSKLFGQAHRCAFLEPDEEDVGRWENEGGFPQWSSNYVADDLNDVFSDNPDLPPSWYWKFAFVALLVIAFLCAIGEACSTSVVLR